MKRDKSYFYLMSIFLTLTIPACSYLPKEMKVPVENVIMFDRLGKPLRPTGNIGDIKDKKIDETSVNSKQSHISLFGFDYTPECDDEYKKHIKRIENNMDVFFKKRQMEKKRLLIFIHGGLNTQVGSLERIVECFQDGKSRVETIEDAGYFPVFINWKSSLVSSYFEHLLLLRQGENKELYAPLTSPIVLATDIGRSLLRWPLVSGNLFINDAKTIPANRDGAIEKVAKQLICLNHNEEENKAKACINDKYSVRFKIPPEIWKLNFDGIKGWYWYPKNGKLNKNGFPVTIGEDERQLSEMTINFAEWAITLPTKLLSAPVLDAFGSSAWDVMLRRTDLLFHAENESASLISTDADQGGLSLFLNELAKFIEKDKDNWEITLVGHSMGTIVANGIIKEFGDKLPIKKIVYLASADTIQHYEEAVYPYLKNNICPSEDDIKMNDKKKYICPEMYHFVLHPRAEESESYVLPPRGSLLVWID